MNTPESKNQLAVFDSLLDGLAVQARDSSVSAPQFFQKTIQVIQAVLSPDWTAIFASGPDDSSLLVAGSCPIEPKDCFGSRCDPSVIVSKIRGEVSSDIWGWLVVGLSDDASAIQNEVVEGISEIVHDFIVSHRHTRGATASASEDVFRFTINAHQSLEPVELGHYFTNDARLLMACERVSLFSMHGRRPDLLAVSSVAKIESRSELVSNMKAIARHAFRTRDLFSSDQIRTLKMSDPRLAGLIEKQIESTGLPFLVGVPIHGTAGSSDLSQSKSKSNLIGFMLVESTNEVDRVEFARGLSHVVPHASVAMSNAAQYQSIPFRKTLATIGKWTGLAQLSKMAVVIGVILAAVIAANLIQTEFKVRIRGELRPVVERNVFAPYDATVERVFVNHGDAVTTDQALVQLRSADLEIEIEQSKTELENLAQLKDAKEITLNQVSNANADPSLAAQLASDVTDIAFQIAALTETQKFLLEKRARSKVVCPIQGKVTTWQVKENLINKPIRWGEPILSVAQLDGEWEVLFQVPERRIGYILDRQKAVKGSGVDVEMFLDSSPGNKYVISISEIDQSAAKDPELGALTRIKCLAPLDLQNKRQGATVAADVLCGKRSLWFVWTRELRDALKRRFVW